MLKSVTLLISLFLFSNLHAFLVGNPASPGLYSTGLFSKNKVLYLRCGYFNDNIYRGEYKEDSILPNSPLNILKLRSQGALITVNVKQRWDIYTLVGGSKMNFDNQVHTKDHLCWCLGTKILLYKINNFDLSVDGKYFQTKQDVERFIIEDKVFSVVTENFGFDIEQYQASLGLSYKIKMFVPYVGATYLYSTIKPYPTGRGLIQYPYPYEDMIDEFKTNDTINSHKWGFVGGVTIISNNMVSVNVETRLIDQEAVNVSAEIRF